MSKGDVSRTVHRALSAVSAAGVALLPLLIDQHVISAAVGTDIGVAYAAAVGGWTGVYVASRMGNVAPAPVRWCSTCGATEPASHASTCNVVGPVA